MPFRSRRNNDDEPNAANSASRQALSESTTSTSRRQRNQALAMMLGRLSSLTKNSSPTPLFIDTSMDTNAKVDEEGPSPVGTASTTSLSTIESEHRLSATSRSPQFANAMLSPSFQLPSPTDENPKNKFQVTFAKQFSNMFDTTDDDSAAVLDAIEEETDDCEQVEDLHDSSRLFTTTKDEVISSGARENQGDSTIEETQDSGPHLSVSEEIEVSENNVIESESDPFQAIRLGELENHDTLERPPKRRETPVPEEDHDENEDGLIVRDQSVHSETSEKTNESKGSRFSLTQEELNSPTVSTIGKTNNDADENTPETAAVEEDHDDNEDCLTEDQSVHSATSEKPYESKGSRSSLTQEALNSPILSTKESLTDRDENTPKPTCSPHPQDIIDSPASQVSYLSISAMDSPMVGSENQDRGSPKQPNKQFSQNDAFTASRLSMAGEIEVLDENQNHDRTSETEVDLRGESETSSREGRPPLVPILPKSQEALTNVESDWDSDLDPIDFIRYGNAISQGRPPLIPERRKDCVRYKTWQAVHQRLQESCPDDMDWDELDPVLVDRYRDGQPFHFESKERRSQQTSDPSLDGKRQKSWEVVRLRLQQSSPSDSDWHEHERELEADDENSETEETASAIWIEGEDITLRTIRMRYKQLQAHSKSFESRQDKYSDEMDSEYHYDDLREDGREENWENYLPSQYLDAPTVSQTLESTSRWYRETGALPPVSYQGSGPVDFDEVYENTYRKKSQTLRSNLQNTPHADTIYLLWKRRGQPIGVYLRKFKRRHGIYVERLDPNGLACRAAVSNAASEFRVIRRSIFSSSKLKKRISSDNRTPSSRVRSVGRLSPGMKIDMINGQPCPSDIQVCSDIIVRTSGWLTLHIS